MKNNRITILRALFSILVGILLIMYPGDTSKFLVVIIGIFFLLPGIISVLSFFFTPKPVVQPQPQPEGGEQLNQEPQQVKKEFPILGVGGIILGLILMIRPSFFINIFMYILGAVLIIAASYQIVEYASHRKNVHVPFLLYVIPVLVFLAGIFIFFKPIESASLPFIVIGVSSIVYGISEFVKAYKFRHLVREELKQIELAKAAANAEDAEAVEVTQPTEPTQTTSNVTNEAAEQDATKSTTDLNATTSENGENNSDYGNTKSDFVDKTSDFEEEF